METITHIPANLNLFIILIEIQCHSSAVRFIEI